MRDKSSLILGVAIMACSGWAVFAASGWPWKAALFPLVIGIPVFCLAAAEVLWVLLGSVPANQAMDSQLSPAPPGTGAAHKTLRAVAWMLGFFGVIALIGFPLAVPAFVFVYLKWQGREGWGYSLVFSLVVWVLFHVVFQRLLNLPFPAGWVQGGLGLG